MERIKIINLFLFGVILFFTCAPKSYMWTTEGKTINVYFIKPNIKENVMLVDKTQFHLFRDSEGSIVPVRDSTNADYFIQFRINTQRLELREPENKLYEITVWIESAKDKSLSGMTVAKAKGKIINYIESIAKKISSDLISVFNELYKEDTD